MKRNLSLIGAAIAVLMLLHGCTQNTDNTNNGTTYPAAGEGTREGAGVRDTLSQVPDGRADVRRPDMKVRVRKGHALLLETEGFQLTAVDTAVRHEGVYSVTSLVEEDLEPLPQGMKNMTAAAAGYRLLPGGEHFAPYAEVRVAYDPARLPLGYTPEDIYTSYYDTVSLAWVRLERLGIDTANREIVSATTHFTDFINELLQSPEMPETQAFVPTQMSGLEAANPLAGYSTIAPPVANNMGTANLTYPIQVPAGRGGMQPNLALTYNSNGGNGLCGMGWDLQIPCISVETRWGVPLYDPQKETETYLLNGEQLLVDYDAMPTFAKEYEPRNTNFIKRFYPRVEGAFDSILRYGYSPQTYWWEVYDRSGTRYIYGLGDGELRSQQQNAVAKWYLTRVIDRNNNATRYHYSTCKNAGGGAVSGTAIYLDKISYSAPDHGLSYSPWYGYGVTFHYEDSRSDPVISGNYGVKENICRRLHDVKTWYVRYNATSDNYYKEWEWYTQNPSDSATFVPPTDPDTIKILNGIKTHIKEEERRKTTARLLNQDSCIQSDSSLIRGYRLLYEQSTTGKSLLSAVVEMSPGEWDSFGNNITCSQLTNNSTFKYHRFNYRGPRSDKFGQPRTISTEIGEAKSGLSDLKASPLGGGCSYRENFYLSPGVGIGKAKSKRTFNIEISGNISPVGSSKGTTSMIDLNGDGYPDLLYNDAGEWKCQLFSPEEQAYRSSDEVIVSLPTNGFSQSVTRRDYSIGANGHAGWEYEDYGVGFNVGLQYTHSSSDNTMYFADVNADGKPDIVRDGIVWFNNSYDDTITFGREFISHKAPDMPCEISYFAIDRSEPLNDSIFEEGHKSETYISWFEKNGFHDTSLVTQLKPHYQDSLRRSVVRVWVAPEKGRVIINGTARLDSLFNIARKRTDADGVHVSIQHNDIVIPGKKHDLTNEHPEHDMSVPNSFVVEKGDRLYFRVEALKNDLYDIVDWKPTIVYSGKDTAVLDSAGRPRYVFSAKDDFLAWQDERLTMPLNGKIRISSDYQYEGIPQSAIILKIIQSDTSGSNETVLDSVILNPTDMSSGNSQHDSLITWEWDAREILDTNQTIYFKAESQGPVNWAKLSWFPRIISTEFENGDPDQFTMQDEDGNPKTIYAIDKYLSPIFPKETVDGVPNYIDTSVFGNTYHGWGYFVYNSYAMRTPIDESKIKKDPRYQTQEVNATIDDINTNYNHPVSTDDLLGGLDTILPNSDQDGVSSMVAMFEYGKTDCRILLESTGRNYITPSQTGLYNWYSVQAAMAGDSTLLVPVTNKSIAASGLTAVGPIKGTEQNGFGIHASGGISLGGSAESSGVAPSVCFNYSNGENYLTEDFIDLNGDGYPDVMSETEAQYTNPWGGLSKKRGGINPLGEQGIQNTDYHAFSLQGGTSFAVYKKFGKNRGTVNIHPRSSTAGIDIGGDRSTAVSKEHAELAWIDINGDGLPDCMDGDGNVAINLGYGYYLKMLLDGTHNPFQNSSRSFNRSSNAGFSGAIEEIQDEVENSVRRTVNTSFSTGKATCESYNTGEVVYSDITGDGLVDKIVDGDKIYYNKGWGFTSSYPLDNIDAKPQDITHNVDYSGNITLGASWSLFKIQFGHGPSVSNSASTTQRMLLDMNGDGLPDIVTRAADGTSINVQYNQLYDVDKLVSVQSFYGNRMDISYAQAPYSPGARQRPTVMQKLTVSDKTGESDDKRVHRFGYDGYVHSIEERTAYGFENVMDTQLLNNAAYRITRQHYRTDHYKMRGRKASELVTDAVGRPYVENEWVYELKRIDNGNVVPLDREHCDSTTWPALDSVITRYYEPSVRAVRIETAERYVHADNGRVVRYNKHNNIAVINTDDVFCTMTYTRRSRNQSALPADVKVKDARGNLLRHRFAEYDNAGHLIRLTLDDGSQLSVSEYGDDGFGNVAWFRGPENATGQRVKLSYTYDSLVHMFPTITEDSAFGDRSRVEYDVRLGLPLRVYSIGGDSISYTYDGWGRPRTIRAPQEWRTDAYPTIRYRYWDGNDSDAPQFNSPRFRSITGIKVTSGKATPVSCGDYSGWPIWAQTLHRSQADQNLNVTTILFADGHGRVLQTKKTAVIDGRLKKVVSGHIDYDDAGRPTKAYEPFESDMDYCKYHTPSLRGVVTLTSYDILDRVVESKIQISSRDNIVTRNTYGFSRVGNAYCFSTETTDPERRQSITMTDARGLTTKSIDAMLGETRFEYDILGQLSRTYDPDNFMTEYGYDKLGRLSYRIHPDAGRTDYTYDPAGNLIRETNPLGQIQYIYNYQRLTDKQYSNLTLNNVHYEYGTTGRNRGRITKVTDGSGVQSFGYDAMGNVSKSVRVLSVPAAGYAYTFTHSYGYDSWGRMHTLTYPDGEQVTYHYSSDGNLVSMSGTKRGNPQRWYINKIQYNKHGQRTYIEYGNRSYTKYGYDSLQRLSILKSDDGLMRPMQQITYKFDKVGNITSLSNDASPVDGLGGSYTNTYRYDNLNRLIEAHGTGDVGGQTREFNINTMQYSRSGRLMFKDQDQNSVTTPPTGRGLPTTYGYDANGDHPHAPHLLRGSGIRALLWDNAGNLSRTEGINGYTRDLFWTEDNRLFGVVDNRHYSYYAYDHTGQRTLKMTGDASSVDQNAWAFRTIGHLNHVTLYPSPYLVVSEQGYTKHYYAGADRVAARIGSGGLKHDTTCISQNDKVSKQGDELFWIGLKSANSRDLKSNIERLKKLRIVDLNGKEIPEWNKFDLEQLTAARMLEAKIDPGKIHFTIENFSEEPPYTNAETEPKVYFYHSDHLGGASWITDGTGKPVQHLQYMPFGEPFVNQHPAGYQERYTFTGKERDVETGYGYFGARYMDFALLTSFISVDRYASKYPFISPYAYCAWNPIKLIDPTGDTLFALDRQSQNDIKNLAGPYKNRVVFNERGVASIDYSELTEDEIAEMKKNSGISLINDIATSSKRILYEASDLVLCTNNDGSKLALWLGTDKSGIENYSRGGLDSDGAHTHLPREGYDGQVVVSPTSVWYNNKGFPVPREIIVGHELAENYARTVLNCNYLPDENGLTDMAKLGAHAYANKRMHNPNKKYSHEFRGIFTSQMIERINEYYGCK